MRLSKLYGDVSGHPTLMVGSMITGSAVHHSEPHFRRHKEEMQTLWPFMEWQGHKTSGYRRCLDIGGGHGVHAPWLLQMADELIVTDLINYNDLYEGSFINELSNELKANGESFDPSRVEFHRGDAQNLIYKDDLFDLVISINAFEHIPEPAVALSEAVRVAASGAVVYIQFDPLWHSPYGHHLWHLGFEPWAHLLAPDGTFPALIREAGGNQLDVDVFERDMNRKPFSYFQASFQATAAKAFRKSYINYWAKDEIEEPAISHPNFERCLDLGFSRDDLLVRGFQFIGELM